MPNPTIFTSVINLYLPEPHASLLSGIIFGVPLKSAKEFYFQLKTVGLLHMVVLSGINITMLASIITSATTFLGKLKSTLLTILVIIIFIVFVGPQAPVIRAGFMGILTLVAILYGRKNFAFYSLFISAILIAVVWPKWLTTISFWLSYGATLGIMLFGPKIKATNVYEQIKQDIQISLSAQTFTTPLIFIYFKEISLISPLANIFVSFLIPPLMIMGFLTAFLGKINYFLGLPFAYLCYGLLSYMVFIISILSKSPFIYFKFH